LFAVKAAGFRAAATGRFRRLLARRLTWINSNMQNAFPRSRSFFVLPPGFATVLLASNVKRCKQEAQDPISGNCRVRLCQDES
jgi:hypothetical protein